MISYIVTFIEVVIFAVYMYTYGNDLFLFCCVFLTPFVNAALLGAMGALDSEE